MNEVTLILPIASSKLHPNGRTHWAVKAKLTKAHRQLSCVECMHQTNNFQPKWKAASVEYKLYSKVKRRRDQEGVISVNKSYMDGIQDAKLILDDCGVTFLPVVMEIDKANPRLEIIIREIPQ